MIEMIAMNEGCNKGGVVVKLVPGSKAAAESLYHLRACRRLEGLARFCILQTTTTAPHAAFSQASLPSSKEGDTFLSVSARQGQCSSSPGRDDFSDNCRAPSQWRKDSSFEKGLDCQIALWGLDIWRKLDNRLPSCLVVCWRRSYPISSWVSLDSHT